ncbi:GTP-binding protein [Seinonella peptonophila]|uniref:Large ribosomal subunit assembly factor BipA n=1 Tax=Seinonella peptonophila TaxID=112248 RepID=A0A1M4TQM3_9BACL|nr:translational GTPase TypA [Seinonella peptonophila]SHE46695.1 GTP-binding protein [Seinonella peptonophila]
MNAEQIRNIAIIAHVDHGKTTLVDAMLKQSQIFRSNQQVADRVLDSNELEQERGITILSKNTAIQYKETKINIVDTPGHADFGGEVERVMNMVDGVLLLVDAVEGPMPQTKFVLKQALERGHRVIVVVNKIDRPHARPDFVIDTTFDLFVELGATDEQCEFPIIYASGLSGVSGEEPDQLTENLVPLFETIVHEIPSPQVNLNAPTLMQATLLGYDQYKGQIVIGRLAQGTIHRNQTILLISADGKRRQEKITQVFTHRGLTRQETDTAYAGDIIALTGLGKVGIGDTLCDPEHPQQLPPIQVEEPTIQMTVSVNTSPFAGQEGTYVTSVKLRERLFREAERDVALKVEEGNSSDTFLVSGRGELHLSILIENLRREGYEFQVSKPEVIIKEIDGKKHEPVESVEIEVSQEYQGTVVELLGRRKGELKDMELQDNGLIKFRYLVPSRGLIGFRQQLLTATRGHALVNTLFEGYQPFLGIIQTHEFGSLIAWETGTATTYALHSAQERGQLYITPGTEVYEGMVVGEHIRDSDLEVNVCKKKHLTSIRRATAEEALRLDTPRQLSLDEAFEILKDDELLEVTPKSYRLRKKYLRKNERTRMAKQKQHS